jgi:exopolysaccharide production protein ExoQ
MAIPLTPREWSAFHSITPSRLERVIAVLVVFVYAAQFPTVWFRSYEQPALTKSFPSYYELAFLMVAAALAWAAIGWSLSSLVTAMRLEPLLPLFMAWVLASSLWSSDPAETFREAVRLLTVVGLGYWLAARFSLADLLGLAAVGMAGVVLVQVAFVALLPEYGRTHVGWVGTFGHKNLFGRIMALTTLVFVLAARSQRRHRVTWWLFAATSIVLTVGSQSKTSLLVVVSLPLIAMVCSAFRARRTLYGAIAVTLVGGCTVATWAGLIYRPEIASALGKDPHLTGRTQLWLQLIPELRRRPLQGFGLGGYWTSWNGPSASMLKRLGWVAGHAHNAFFQVTLDLGLVGFALLFALTIRLLVRGARVVRWYRGAVGLFPLLFATLTVLISISEFGIVRPDAIMLMLAPACVAAARGRRDVLTFERSRSLTSHRPAAPPAPILVLVGAASSDASTRKESS